ncbi:MAG: BrnT family toxin [Pyrinomonadaceae bacterium]
MDRIDVEWDPEKDQLNAKKHKTSFAEAATVFDDPFAETIDDPDHSETEHRFVTVGRTSTGTLLVVVHTFRDDKIRLISARRPTRKERHNYENAE